jgi:alkylation response protein AidB-like acyl-CoA dehydrogenase
VTATSQLAAIQFHLKAICKLDTFLSTDTFSHIDHEMIEMMLEQTARFSEEHLAPLAASGDAEGCRLEQGQVFLPTGTTEAYQAWCELGFPLLSIPLENEGMGFPLSLQCAVQDLMDGANLAFGMMSINLRCAALTLLRHAPETLVSQWLPALVSGEAASTIVISEPQAGSDAGRILTRATPAEEGNWKISGNKIWISYADHDVTENILHLVLARVPGDEIGTRGLGLFAVPKLVNGQPNGISISRLEEKMGLHASPTCVVEFSQSVGTLIGEPTQGIRNLFSMMNAMRLSVGVQGAATACAATDHAIAFALERPQGGRPDQPPVMIAEHADVKRMLLSMTATSELLRALALKTASLLDQDALSETPGQSDQLKLAELLLPLTKTLSAELGFEVVNQGIQVLGGSGYTSDYPLERMARDLRVASIYEGTSGIQALDFVKRKVLADEGQTLNSLLAMITADMQKAASGNPLVAGLRCSVDAMREVFAHLGVQAATSRHAVDPACYPTQRLAGLLCLAWNGLTLYESAGGQTIWEIRLRAALACFSASLSEEARVWAARAISAFPDHDIRID